MIQIYEALGVENLSLQMARFVGSAFISLNRVDELRRFIEVR